MPRVGLLIIFILCTLKAFSQNVKSLVDLGDKAFGKGLFNEAVTKYKAALKLTPDDPKILFKTGVAVLSSNRKYDALDYLKKALELKKDVSPEMDYYLGHAYQERL